MKKLKLDLNDLDVNSFETNPVEDLEAGGFTWRTLTGAPACCNPSRNWSCTRPAGHCDSNGLCSTRVLCESRVSGYCC